MRKIDFRTLDEARRYAFRKQAIDLIKSGKRKGEYYNNEVKTEKNKIWSVILGLT